MTVIKVRTPDGIEEVRIAGDSPTEEEQQAIIAQFFPEQEQAAMPTVPEVNLADASVEEIEEYRRNLEQAGINPETMEPFKAGETGSLKDPGVDYETGLQDYGLRAGFGARELVDEKIAYLTDKIGEEGFRQDDGGRFIITQAGREKLGLGEGKEFAIDEEGISRYDVADFAGEAGVPLGVGLGAGLLMSGSGFLIAAPVVGVSMGLAKLADEAYETSLGYQRQTPEEIRKDAVMEGVFGVLGEGAGRFISSVFGRLLKGPATKEAEAARAEARELLGEGFRPTIEGAAPGVRPILNRLQAIYEGVFPNQKAADDNLRNIVSNLRSLGTYDDATLSSLEGVVKQDIEKMFMSSEDAVRSAYRALDDRIDADIKAIIEPLRRGDKLSEESIANLVNAKAIFDEQADSLFSRASQAISGGTDGRGNRIIPVADLARTLSKFDAQMPVKDQLGGSQLGGIINEAKQNARSLLASRGLPVDMPDDELLRYAYITPEKAQIARKIITNLGYSEEFKGTVQAGMQAALKRGIDDAFFQGEQNLNLVANFMKARHGTGELSQAEAAGLRDLMDQSGMVFAETPSVGGIEKLVKGLSDFQRARKYYAEGMKRFGDPIVEKIYKETGAGTIKLDPTVMLDELVKGNQPELLRRYFRAVRGTPAMQGLAAGEQTLARSRITFGNRDLTLQEARSFLTEMPEDTAAAIAAKRDLASRIQREETRRAGISEARGKGVEAQEAVRQSMARAWFQRELGDPSNYTEQAGVRVLDGIKIANKIDELGSTAKVLFKGEIKELNQMTKLLRQTGAEFDPKVLEQFGADTMAGNIRLVNQALKDKAAFNGNSFLNAVRNNDSEGIVSAIFQRGNADRIKQFNAGTIPVRTDAAGRKITLKDFGTISQEAKDQVQTAAMGRILRSLGDIDSPAFRESFISGRLGTKLQSTLEGYGRNTIEAMFGKETSDGMFKLADNMVRVSNSPIAGKGGLAAPQIAIGLGIYGMLTAPFATLPAAAFYYGMSRALRNPTVMKVMLASREPSGDTLGQALQFMNTTAAQSVQEISRAKEGPTKMPPEVKQVANQVANQAKQTAAQVLTQAPQVAPAVAGTAAQVSPILLPDPATAALAQSLGRTTP